MIDFVHLQNGLKRLHLIDSVEGFIKISTQPKIDDEKNLGIFFEVDSLEFIERDWGNEAWSGYKVQLRRWKENMEWMRSGGAAEVMRIAGEAPKVTRNTTH